MAANNPKIAMLQPKLNIEKHTPNCSVTGRTEMAVVFVNDPTALSSMHFCSRMPKKSMKESEAPGD